MAKIQCIIESCNDCKFCKVFEQVGNHGGPYAAICLEFDLLLKINVSSDPTKSNIQIPDNCELVDYKFPKS